jgi:hypothetical protein
VPRFAVSLQIQEYGGLRSAVILSKRC